jgi:hypothetical protein
MTDQPNPGTNPEEGAPEAPKVPPDASSDVTQPYVAPEPPMPAFEPADAGLNAPAQTVARDTGTFGGEEATLKRSNGVRWAIAIGGVAIVIAATIAILTLASGRPSPSVAVGYMPANTMQYAEYRLDLPGDQRAKMAGFLSKFPGFADQANVQAKLYEVFDRIVLLASSNDQSYTADIEPWFGGQIAMGSGLGSQSATGGGLLGAAVTPFGGDALFIVTVKDPAKATEWLKSTAGETLAESQYGGATIYTLGNSGSGASFILAVTDKVLLGGSDATVRAAIDSKGEGKLADDNEFKAAFGSVSRDYVGFGYIEYRSLLKSVVAMSGASGLESTTVDDELIALVPEWQASSMRFEDDALVGNTAFPSIEIGYEAKNKKSTLIGHAPAGTIVYAESHDIGPALLAVVDRFRQMKDLQEAFRQIDSAAGVVGGFDGAFGWWGDAAVVISKDAAGSVAGGLLIAPSDAAAAKRTFDTLRSFVVLAGGGSGIEIRDVPHGDATISVIDLSEAAEASGASLPPGVKAEIAYAVTGDVVVVGYTEAFVASVLDAGPGPSLADDSRFASLVKRVGEENIGLSFVDVKAVRELIEPLIKPSVPQEQWAFYEREVLPYLLPLDAFVSSARIDGDVDRLDQAFTVRTIK